MYALLPRYRCQRWRMFSRHCCKKLGDAARQGDFGFCSTGLLAVSPVLLSVLASASSVAVGTTGGKSLA